MNASLETAREDLAFLRAVTEGDGRLQHAMGAAFAVGGGLYGLQCLTTWAAVVTQAPLAPAHWQLLSFGPTILFVIFLAALIARTRGSRAKGATARAVGAVFQAAGLTNLVLVAIFAPAASGGGGLAVWLYYPAVVCALFGGAWWAAFMLMRRGWFLLAALGWSALAVALGFLNGSAAYLLVFGAGLIVLMMIPGLAIMRQARAR